MRLRDYPAIFLNSIIWSFWYYAVRTESPIGRLGDYLKYKRQMYYLNRGAVPKHGVIETGGSK